jgi:hypothetical protein
MVRIAALKASILLAAGSVGAVSSLAQETQPPSPTPPAANPIVGAPGSSQPATPDLTAKPRRHRAISPEVAAQLSAATPKFTPPPPKPPPPPEEDQPDLRDTDKPKNGIIRLPKYVVRDRPVVLSEHAVNTQAGLASLAMKKYFNQPYWALNSFTLPLFGTSPEKQALAMYAEDERLKNMAELSDDARMVGSADKEQGKYVKKQVDATYVRPGDFDWKPIGR